jgi:hypothetical protein
VAYFKLLNFFTHLEKIKINKFGNSEEPQEHNEVTSG